MSLFQNVIVELVCERCGITRETNVRFHSAVTYDADYRVGECVPEADGLRVGEKHEGNADRYCWGCLRKWVIAHAYSAYEALADLMQEGRALITLKGNATPATAQDIIECAHGYVDDLLEWGAMPVTTPPFEELEIIFEGDPVIDSIAANGKLLGAIEPLIEEKLRQREWRQGASITEDFLVIIDNEYRIHVKDMGGRSLCPGR